MSSDPSPITSSDVLTKHRNNKRLNTLYRVKDDYSCKRLGVPLLVDMLDFLLLVLEFASGFSTTGPFRKLAANKRARSRLPGVVFMIESPPLIAAPRLNICGSCGRVIAVVPMNLEFEYK